MNYCIASDEIEIESARMQEYVCVVVSCIRVSSMWIVREQIYDNKLVGIMLSEENVWYM